MQNDQQNDEQEENKSILANSVCACFMPVLGTVPSVGEEMMMWFRFGGTMEVPV